MPKITVVNKYKEPDHTYCGRGTVLGNPFVMRNKTDAERNRVCDLYDAWFTKQVNDVQDPKVMHSLEALLTQAKHFDVNLGCFCAPKRCHCDTIKRYLEWRLTN